MAGHFKQEDTKKRSRRPLVVGAVVGVLVVAAVGFHRVEGGLLPKGAVR